jgi:omega-amidase
MSAMLRAMDKLKVALCQIKVGADKIQNIETASKALEQSAKAADLLVLPECWNSPYAVTSFPKYAEIFPPVGEKPKQEESPSTFMLSTKAAELGKWIIGGSVPETDGSNVYNTCPIFDPQGTLIAKHRKVHLFDIDIPGRITFKESDSLTRGDGPTVFHTPWGNIGVGICYDIRFPEYATVLRSKGADVIVYPGAFNMVTGPAHWELLQRGRAVDNQVFVMACSPARDPSGGYVAWGHSTVVSPWGEVLATTDESESIVYAELDLTKADEMRTNIPCWRQKRTDLYELRSKM